MEKSTCIRAYLETLLTEKGISNLDGWMEIEGHIGISYRDQIEFIMENASSAHKERILNTFTLIDFKNGDVFHYWNHITEGMLLANGYEVSINKK